MSSEFSPQQQSLRLMGLLEQCVTWDKNEAAEYCTKVCKCLTEHQGGNYNVRGGRKMYSLLDTLPTRERA